jgi:hypothetical protein
VSEDGVLRRIFGCERDNVMRLENIEDIISIVKSSRIGWVGFVARRGSKKSQKSLVGKPEGKRPLGRPRPTWEDNIKWILRK